MKYNVPFEHTTFLTLLSLLKFESKRIISINDLIISRNILLSKALDDYHLKNVKMYDISDWQGEIEFCKLDLNKELPVFLKKYEEIIEYDNNEIKLKENINYKRLEKQVNDFNINDRIIIASKSKEFFDSLKLKYIPKIIKSFSKLEQETETTYLKYMNNEHSKKEENDLKIKLFERFVFIKNLSLLNDNVKEALANYSMVISCDDDYEYKTFPFDEEHYCDSKYFDKIFSLQDSLYELNQYAIFGEGKISRQKVYDILSDINIAFNYDYEEEEEEEEEEEFYYCDDELENEKSIIKYFDDDYELFTLYYIKNINDFMERYGKNSMLNLAKYRLLYVIDNPDLMLYKEENFNKVLELVEPIKQINIDNFNENEDILLKPLDCYKAEAEYFIVSCFESKFDKYTIKKLLFTATYYELTCDEDIENLLEKYKDNMNYEFYKSVIYNKGMGYSKNIRKN